MAITFSDIMTNIINNRGGQQPQVLPKVTLLGGRARQQISTVVLAAQATGAANGIVIASLPKGAAFLGAELVTDTSLGSSTVAIQNGAASPVIYAAAATMTATDAPSVRTKTAVHGVPIAAPVDYLGNAASFEDLILVVATAALPASGTLRITTRYTID